MTQNSENLHTKLHEKLDDCSGRLRTAQGHLEDVKNETATNIEAKLTAAKEALDAKKQEALAAKNKAEELGKAKLDETTEAVAAWKANRHAHKLGKRAEPAESYADACVALAEYYAEEAEVAILEAVAARQDANNSD